MRTFEPRLGILPPAQRRCWPALAPAAGLGFVLYGGTAIALRLGHRPSIDFDFFSDLPLDRASIQRELPFVARSTVLQDERDAWTMLTPPDPVDGGQVKVSFFGGLDFGRVGEPERSSDGVLIAASLADLLATKVKVVLQRAEAKDYRDIATLLAAGGDLSAGLAAAAAMYGPGFQPSESLRALVFFKDGDLPSLSDTEKGVLVAAASKVRALPPVAIVSRRLG
jgi:hypothetical protein